MSQPLLIIGAMKCGTSALFQALVAHSSIGGPSEKELDFFIEEGRWARGLPWYRSQFPSGALVWCEASPTYTTAPYLAGAPARAATALPTALLIYIVRDPVERIVSHYLHLVSAHQEQRSFDEVVDRLHLERDDIDRRRSSGFAADRFPDLLPHQQFQGYLARSMYMYQASRWLKRFDRHRLLVLTQDQLMRDAPRTMRDVGGLLGFDLDVTPEQRHVTADKRRMNRLGTSLRNSVVGRHLRESRFREPLRRAGRSCLYRDLPSVTVTEAQRNYIHSLLGDDTAAFESEFGLAVARIQEPPTNAPTQSRPR